MVGESHLAEITIRNQPESKLLTLPPELRNKIYVFSLCRKWRIKGGLFSTVINKEHNALSLLLVCRQIHAEAALVPFINGLFDFYDLAALQAFPYDCLYEHQRNAVREIEIDAFFDSKKRGLGFDPPSVCGLKWALATARLEGLKHIHVRLFYDKWWNGFSKQRLEEQQEALMERTWKESQGVPFTLELVIEQEDWDASEMEELRTEFNKLALDQSFGVLKTSQN